MPAIGPRMEFVRGALGPAGVTPLGQQDSSALAALSAADCLIARPIGAAPAITGEMVQVFAL
jgi:molybdopterin molybdotransferase